ncbi:uncharacterized protein N7482_004697 [Penicillium canariense]|uniref:Ell binding protein Ebp1 C-terminal domain-containing protein n=1 Tax=Penicillium canariense TaxID=189055 RepID=A0A9W9LQR6_9EURO|nr:uncharacterized protein N7482_004697 [Penicillium canariense]KAJ5169103.1 hypothetical protein N7482_004697 [Penicillium canariense]
MSVNDQPSSADITLSSLASQPATSDLDALDHRLKRLSDDVLPLHPYLLTLPTNAPFRLGSRSSTNWAVGDDRPFRSDEQELQYMTFLTHHDTDSLLVAVGDWSDESGRMMLDRSTGPRTTTENPKETGTKKKISLSDYKNQKNTGATPSPAIHDQRNRNPSYSDRRDETPRAPKPDPVKKKDKTESHLSNTPKPSSQFSPTKTAKKRPSTADPEPVNSHATKESNMPSPKKARLSPEKHSRRESTAAKSLPILLSPTLPPSPGPDLSSGSRLPRLLSPTLPPEIEKELAQLKETSPAPRSPKRDNAAAKPKRDQTSHSRTPNFINSGSNSSLQSCRAGALPKGANSSRLTLIVRLRYGKGNRKRVEGLLKFSGKRKAHRADSPPGQDTDLEDAPHIEKKRDVGPTRGNASSDQVKVKMKHETDETTPDPSGGGSRVKEPKPSVDKPHPPTHDKVKPTSLTPVKESKGSGVRRIDLTDGDGQTPVNPANKRLSVDPGTKGSPSQSDIRPRNHERRDHERKAWREDFQKFGNIGRELKHTADRYNSGASATDEKLAVVTAIEAILCFVLAFVADDQSKVLSRQGGDSSTWRSIIAYWRVVTKNSVSYPVLHSLCQLLGAVSYDTIHALDLDRLALTPLPGEHTPVPTPGSDGNTVLADENKKSRKEFLELKTRLPEFYKESQKLWLDGTRSLSEDVLSRDFPTTWSRRSHHYAERGRASLKPGEYSGEYFLPLGAVTRPIEVVRFGWSLLQEWCAQEGVEWNGRLDL